MRCAVVVRQGLARTDEVRGVLAALRQGCDELILPAGWEQDGCATWKEVLPDVDLVAALGGDGTLLIAVHLLAGREGQAAQVGDVDVVRACLQIFGWIIHDASNQRPGA